MLLTIALFALAAVFFYGCVRMNRAEKALKELQKIAKN